MIVATDYADPDREILEHEAEIRKRDRNTRQSAHDAC